MTLEVNTMEEDETAAKVDREVKKSMKTKRGAMRFKYKLLLIILSLLLMAFLRTGFIFILIAILPSIVAYYMDVSAERYRFKTIFACNLCAMLPYLEIMLHAGPSSAVLQSLMGNLTHWIIIFGSALGGWLLSEICPMVAQIMVVGVNQTQIAHLQRVQKKIETEWGPEVVQLSTPPENDY